MKTLKKEKTNFFIILILFLIAGLAECIISLHYNELSEHPLILNLYLSIRPIYNENGSLFHAKSGIGYVRWLLLSENIITVFLLVYLFRFLDAWNIFFQISRSWLYILDFAAANTIYRLFTNIRGVFPLDYLKVRNATYDFPDLYLGICFIGLIFWLIPSFFFYYRYKKQKLKGAGLTQKIIWELKLTGLFLKCPFLPKEKWQILFSQFDLDWQSTKRSVEKVQD